VGDSWGEISIRHPALIAADPDRDLIYYMWEVLSARRPETVTPTTPYKHVRGDIEGPTPVAATIRAGAVSWTFCTQLIPPGSSRSARYSMFNLAVKDDGVSSETEQRSGQPTWRSSWARKRTMTERSTHGKRPERKPLPLPVPKLEPNLEAHSPQEKSSCLVCDGE